MGSKWCIYRLGDIAEFSYGKMPKKEGDAANLLI